MNNILIYIYSITNAMGGASRHPSYLFNQITVKDSLQNLLFLQYARYVIKFHRNYLLMWLQLSLY